MSDAEPQKKPFIIWTLQRTGGTNFTKNLVSMARLPVEHEPFNRPRAYGDVTKTWEEDRDNDALGARIAEILEKPQIIKHCVEMMPWRISAALGEQSAKAGYGHLFLIRESSLQRLLSMEYAKRTKVWGPSHEKPNEAADPAFDAPLDAEALAAHEEMGITRLNEFWKRLRKAKAAPIALSFEQLYESSPTEARQKIEAVLEHLSLTSPGPVADLVADLREGGNQNTRDRYARFKGIEDLSIRLARNSRLLLTP